MTQSSSQTKPFISFQVGTEGFYCPKLFTKLGEILFSVGVTSGDLHGLSGNGSNTGCRMILAFQEARRKLHLKAGLLLAPNSICFSFMVVWLRAEFDLVSCNCPQIQRRSSLFSRAPHSAEFTLSSCPCQETFHHISCYRKVVESRGLPPQIPTPCPSFLTQ